MTASTNGEEAGEMVEVKMAKVIDVVVDQIEDEDFRIGKPKLYILVEYLDGSREHLSFSRFVEEGWQVASNNR